MLISLTIKNFVIVEHVYIDFCTSLTVITGETGAGKSLVIDAILFCFGGKFEAHIRKDADQCSVIAEFDIKDNLEIKKFLDENSIEYDSTIIVKRQDTIAQRKKFFVNDQQVTQKLISQLAFYLLEIHGQHSTTILLDSKSHIIILDNYANLGSQKNTLQDDYRSWQETMRKINSISSKRQQNLQEISYLEFIIKELQEAAIRPDEEDQLVAKRNKLQQLFNQQKTVYQAIHLIEESNFNKTAI